MISQKPKICLALDNIRSTHNVGSIFRTADAIGVNKIYLCGVTPSPIDRFGRERKDIAKVALGAEKNIEWENSDDIISLIKKMKKLGYKIIALEQDKNSINYKKVKIDSDAFIILGEETKGIKREILDLCDHIVEIPMKGNKESLNVSVATGVLLYTLLDTI
jgi:tRNA G18 (ribose-2'-O)-methylase SpoU